MHSASSPFRPKILAQADQACDARLVNEASRIVVGVDHSEESLEALEFAVEEAALRGVGLEVVWAWSDHLPPTDVSGEAIDGVDIGALAQVQLDGLVANRVPADIDVTVRAVSDKPESALMDSARSAGLLVVGARGRGGFLGLRLGSVSSKVTNRAPCPIAVVHPTIEEPGTDTEPRIVVGIDGSESARTALRWALSEARIREVPVIAVNGWMEPAMAVSYPGLVAPIEAMEKAAEKLVDAELEVAAQHAPGVAIRAQPVCAGAALALIEESSGASLVVVGSRGRGGFIGRMLGSTAQQVLQHARCPAVVVPSPEDSKP